MNVFSRLLAVLLISLFVSLCLYWLPESILGHDIKKVDLLSDIRIKPESLSIDSLLKQLEAADTIEFIPEAPDSITSISKVDSAALALRDSLFRTLYATGADSTGKQIEDYSTGHLGLARFFSALERRNELGRPVRIAVLGDSFIEGDIVVADLRTMLQAEYGGNGVGFVPVTSVTDQYRPTINQQAEDWESFSMLTDTTHQFFLSGSFFEPQEQASLEINPADKYPQLSEVSSLKLYYRGTANSAIRYVTEDTVSYALPAKQPVGLLEIPGSFHGGTLLFPENDKLQVFGTALESDQGIIVDNFSLRGNSGLILTRLGETLCQDFSKIRPYDLVILQYGLNVVSEEVLNYAWYRNRMMEVVRHVQACYPQADILLMGVSDRGYQTENSFETMPAVLALLHAQRQIAQRTGITFWNTFGAMGGINSMVHFVENNWASKDYTHLSFRGGREIAKGLYNALLLEKEFYDEAEKSLSK